MKRESNVFFQHCNVAYGLGKKHRSERMLRIALGLLGKDVPTSYRRLLQSSIRKTQRYPNQRTVLSESTMFETQQLDVDTFDATGWYQLSRGMFSLGFFRAAWFARENSLTASIVEGSKFGASSTSILRAIQAHIEKGTFHAVESMIVGSSSMFPEATSQEMSDYIAMIKGEYGLVLAVSDSQNSEAEDKFRELITNKTVVLVGPGSPSGEYGDEIDSADTVIRIKYTGREYLPRKQFHGERCDISFYTRAVDSLTDKIGVDDKKHFIDDLQLILSGIPGCKVLKNTLVYNLKSSGPTYRTTSVSGIRTIFQILRFQPRSLKIFGFDFYSKREQYSKEMNSFYAKHGRILEDPFLDGRPDGLRQSEIANSFCGHDVVSNFCFAQNLYHVKLFTSEPYAADILQLTPFKYVERLETMLGNW